MSVCDEQPKSRFQHWETNYEELRIRLTRAIGRDPQEFELKGYTLEELAKAYDVLISWRKVSGLAPLLIEDDFARFDREIEAALVCVSKTDR